MQRAGDALPIEQVASRWIVASDPDDAIAKIKPYVDVGFTHLVFHAPGEDQERFLERVRGADHAGRCARSKRGTLAERLVHECEDVDIPRYRGVMQRLQGVRILVDRAPAGSRPAPQTARRALVERFPPSGSRCATNAAASRSTAAREQRRCRCGRARDARSEAGPRDGAPRPRGRGRGAAATAPPRPRRGRRHRPQHRVPADRPGRDRARPLARPLRVSTWPPAAARRADAELYEMELVRREGTARIVLRGDIDLSARPELERLFAELDRSPSRPRGGGSPRGHVLRHDRAPAADRLHRWSRDNGVPVVFTPGEPAGTASPSAPRTCAPGSPRGRSARRR